MMNGIQWTILLSVVWFVIWHFAASFRVGRRRPVAGEIEGWARRGLEVLLCGVCKTR